jgi:hypothetical protein
MTPINVHEDPRYAKQLIRLQHLSQFISEIAAAIVTGNDEFESVWSIANRVYDRHSSPKVAFISRPALNEADRTALSA